MPLIRKGLCTLVNSAANKLDNTNNGTNKYKEDKKGQSHKIRKWSSPYLCKIMPRLFLHIKQVSQWGLGPRNKCNSVSLEMSTAAKGLMPWAKGATKPHLSG